MAKRYTIIGAGNGGLALAAQFLLAGEHVSLFDVEQQVVGLLQAAGELKVAGVLGEHSLPLTSVHTDLAVAVAGADAIVLVTPAFAHRAVALALGPHLRSGQVVLLMPGRTGGALEFQAVLREGGCQADCLIGETQTLPYAARKTDGNSVNVLAVKRSVPVASLPSERTGDLLAGFPALAGILAPATSVLETSLNNIGMVFHPGPTLLNAGRIEDTSGDFEYYHHGITPAVGRILEKVDAERCAVGRALGVRVVSAIDWLADVYGVQGNSLCEAICANPAYAGITAPPTIQTRYLWEDVATGLVPLAELGRLAGVKTPYTQVLIELASGILDTNFAQTGRTLARIGLVGLDRAGLHRLVGSQGPTDLVS